MTTVGALPGNGADGLGEATRVRVFSASPVVAIRCERHSGGQGGLRGRHGVGTSIGIVTIITAIPVISLTVKSDCCFSFQGRLE